MGSKGKLIPSKPLFDIYGEHEFLVDHITGKSPGKFTQDEVAVLLEWPEFYMAKIFTSEKKPANLIAGFVYEQRRKQNLTTNDLTVTLNGKSALFQNRFRYNPSISLMQVLNRVYGGVIAYSDAEKRAAFREFVEIFETDTKQGWLPRWVDFNDYSARGRFLPDTGLKVPSKMTYIKGSTKTNLANSVEVHYRKYFDLSELSREDVRLGLLQEDYCLQDLVDNYADVCEWIQQQPNSENVLPSQIDIQRYYEHFKDQGAVPWNIYQYWMYGPKPDRFGRMPNGAKPGWAWLRSEAGLEGEVRRSKGKTASSFFGQMDELSIKVGFVVAWKEITAGYSPETGELFNPPTFSQLNMFAAENPSILINGEEVRIPSAEQINRFYPGKYQKLLRDIEEDHDITISFGSTYRIGNLSYKSARSGSSPEDIPRAIAAHRQI